MIPKGSALLTWWATRTRYSRGLDDRGIWENSQMTLVPQQCGVGLQSGLMLIPSGRLSGFASSSQEGLKAALLLCQTLHTAIAQVLLASPAASLPIPLLVGHHGGWASGVSWQGIAGHCTTFVAVATPWCTRKVQAQDEGADCSHCCLPAQSVSWCEGAVWGALNHLAGLTNRWDPCGPSSHMTLLWSFLQKFRNQDLVHHWFWLARVFQMIWQLQ